MKVELTGRQKNKYMNYAYNKIDSIEADMTNLDISLEDINSKSKFKKKSDVNDSIKTRSRNVDPHSNRTSYNRINLRENPSNNALNTMNSPMGGRMSNLQQIPETIKIKKNKLENLEEWIESKKRSIERDELEEQEIKSKKFNFQNLSLKQSKKVIHLDDIDHVKQNKKLAAKINKINDINRFYKNF